MSALHPRFLAESTLGRLARWLRLAGFNTLYDPHPPDAKRLIAICKSEGRTLLTRTRSIVRMAGTIAVHIDANAPEDQIGQLIRQMRLQPEALRPLTRCACCNCRVEAVQAQELYGLVPEYVMQQHAEFKACPQCHHIYWRGSHAQRWLLRMDRWFDFPKDD